MNAWTPSICARRSVAEHHGREPALAHAVDEPAHVVEAREAAEQLARVEVERGGQVAHHAGEVRRAATARRRTAARA